MPSPVVFPAGRRVALGATVIVACCGSAAAQTRLYVDSSRPGDAGPGTSWATAYRSLQTALLQAPAGSEIWVRAGTYRPASAGGARDEAFFLRDGVAVYGGFGGTETELRQRDPALHRTVLSADLNGDDGAGGTGDNAHHVVVAIGVDAGRLDGFVISGAVGANEADGAGQPGGGMFISGGDPVVANCWFLGNRAADGGAALCGQSSGAGRPGGSGGAVYATDSSARFSSCVFAGNRAGDGSAGARCAVLPPGGDGGDGGAVCVVSTAADVPPVGFENCLFAGNRAGNAGAGGRQANANGGPGGSGGNGGALAIAGPVSGVRLVNCAMVANAAGAGGRGGTGDFGSGGNGGSGGSGGALYLAGGQGHEIINATIYQNAAGERGIAGAPNVIGAPGQDGAGGLHGGALIAGATVVNSVVRSNTDRTGTGLGAQITPAPSVRISFSNITGIAAGDGNIDAPVVFPNLLGPDGMAGTADDDLTPAPGSPIVDAGSNPLYRGPATDAAARSRAVDSPGVPDTGVGPGPIVDMGAYELAPACAADFDQQNGVQVADIFAFLRAWFAGCP